ncbi:hypothetical protein N658DRAFT_500097 [Parathielavia hyrcaniae]|uniref:Uncharacterized protein n=1 Tax=Parathielavia hyrcaniae TaxID=113614 RepID=A0AAN6PTQ5_9PEZI|nr:hypothetical protein N658DRAFT_500097 [Parathielavia hyrcaniae]
MSRSLLGADAFNVSGSCAVGWLIHLVWSILTPRPAGKRHPKLPLVLPPPGQVIRSQMRLGRWFDGWMGGMF